VIELGTRYRAVDSRPYTQAEKAEDRCRLATVGISWGDHGSMPRVYKCLIVIDGPSLFSESLLPA
jgi:hypothetical protein